MRNHRREIYLAQLGGMLLEVGRLLHRAELPEMSPEPENCGLSPESPDPLQRIFALSRRLIARLTQLPVSDRQILGAACHYREDDPQDLNRRIMELAAGGLPPAPEDKESYKTAALRSLFTQVEIKYSVRSRHGVSPPLWSYPLAKIEPGAVLYPIPDAPEQATDLAPDYRRLGENLEQDLNKVPASLSLEHFFLEFFYLMQKYTWAVPRDTGPGVDISLFDHLRLCAAFAGCLKFLEDRPKKPEKEFLLLAADISGIQDFLFRLARAAGVPGISKRLRGRSFYLAMLSEILARHLVNRCGLSIANILFCGGGNLEVLLPNTPEIREAVIEVKTAANRWLLDEFGGELQIVLALTEASGTEISQCYWQVKEQAAEKLALAKRQKISELLNEPKSWIEDFPAELPGDQIICPSCRVPLIRESEEICDFCKCQKQIGEKLPKARWLLFLPERTQEDYSQDHRILWVKFGPLGQVGVDTADRLAHWRHLPLNDYQAINRFGDGSAAFTFLAQSLPVAGQEMTLESERDDEGKGVIKPGQALSFSTLADMSTGDPLLGVLKMDVDRLGAIFAHGLGPVTPGGPDLRSIARLATLSRMLSWFFQQEVNRQCDAVFQEWQNTSDWAERQLKDNPGITNTWVSQIFYGVFAGGDDLFLVGPWDQTLRLSQKIHAAFKSFSAQNPNLSISGGLFPCKPKYPINLAAKGAEAALKEAKEQGRNRLAAFGEVAVWGLEDDRSLVHQPEWRGLYAGFQEQELQRPQPFSLKTYFDPHTLTLQELLEWGEEVLSFLQDRKIPRRFLHSLLRARPGVFPPSGKINLMIFPFLHYQLERTIKDEGAQAALKMRLITSGQTLAYLRQIRLPLTYVLTKTRRR